MKIKMLVTAVGSIGQFIKDKEYEVGKDLTEEVANGFVVINYAEYVGEVKAVEKGPKEQPTDLPKEAVKVEVNKDGLKKINKKAQAPVVESKPTK